MFPFSRSWPIYTGTAALLIYGINHYQIAGIENLRLQPRPQTARVALGPDGAPMQNIYGFPSSTGFPGSTGSPSQTGDSSADPRATYPGNPFDVTQYGIQNSSRSPQTAVAPTPGNVLPPSLLSTGHSPATGQWQEHLSAAERFSLLQAEQAAAASTERPTAAAPRAAVAGDVGNIDPGFPISTPIAPPPGFSSLPADRLGSSAFSPPSTASASRSNAGTVSPPPLVNIPPPPNGMENKQQVGAAHGIKVAESRFGAGGSNSVWTHSNDRVRVASFNAEALGAAKLAKPHVLSTLVMVLRQYDIVALQSVRSARDDILPILIDKLNESGRQYDYVIGPRVGRASAFCQFAFVFDAQRVETDRYQLYTVDDPQDLLTYEPLVGWFRCKNVPAKEAFTFSLVNICIAPEVATGEQAVIPSTIAAIAADGRGEDDWILAGDFAGGAEQLKHLDTGAIRFAIRNIPTDVAGTRSVDNLLFAALATTEFTGRSGAFDFLRKYNLSIEQAMEISSHMPVWAEFSVYEGNEPGRIAPPKPIAAH